MAKTVIVRGWEHIGKVLGMHGGEGTLESPFLGVRTVEEALNKAVLAFSEHAAAQMRFTPGRKDRAPSSGGHWGSAGVKTAVAAPQQPLTH